MPDLVTLAALTDGSAVSDWILKVAGNVLLALIALRALKHFAKEDWGAMITMVVAAVFVAGFVWFPSETQSLLGGVWSKVSEA
ncbi:TcpD family membrane protein [Streptomyces sp. NPDC088557]|uniref:TcpD family membrane protein n=1 Tax=Streptomyces sp. NPDC088557 TaxID=3365867 RepID=UPI0037F20799